MKFIKRNDLKRNVLPGRVIQESVGIDAYSKSKRMTMGYAYYSEEAGPMEPHHHAEEIVYILSSDKGSFRFGPAKDNLGESIPLQEGMTLHFPELEWHVFEYEKGGHVDILYFYGQVDNIRPEEILSNK